MNLSSLVQMLWGRDAKFRFLLMAAVLLLFTLLGGRELWTQEHRWADIVAGMFYRQDFLHPYLGENTYYDKPLLSYWLIALLVKVGGAFTTWALRLPSALAGLLAIVSIYRLGSIISDKRLGLLAGWLLLTTFYFVFWARTSSADMLNLAGSLFAITWYYEKREHAGFFDYAVFFMIVALTSLCKGLIGAIVPLIAVLTDVVLRKSWKHYLSWRFFLSVVPALIVYLFPFWASSIWGGESYQQNGLYLVYKENILRYFQPFDHQGPIYTYFLYLPIYLLPWAVLFIPAVWGLRSRWSSMTLASKGMVWTLFILFAFFTLSGSRRSYYVLPMVPFAILVTADWVLAAQEFKRQLWSAALMMVSFVLLFIALDILPSWYYSQVGVERFATALKHEASKTQPWQTWNVVMLDAQSKLNFYLQLPPHTPHLGVHGSKRQEQTAASLLKTWPVLQHKPDHTIFISRKAYASLLQPFFLGYRKVEVPMHSSWSFLKKPDQNAPIAFIPN